MTHHSNHLHCAKCLNHMLSDILFKSSVAFESSLASSLLHSPFSLVSARRRCPLLCT